MLSPRRDGFAPGQHLLEGYGKGGFQFGGVSHVGSILMLPSGVHAWAHVDGQEFCEADFDLVFAESEPMELLIIGTGVNIVPLSPAVLWRFKDRGLRVDLMPTGPAARTYHVLLQEGRRVSAALTAVA